MFVKSLITLFGLTAALSAAAAPFTNGNFENDLDGWTTTGNVNTATPAGGAFWFGAGSAAQNGGRAVVFNGGDSTPNGVLAQTFATTTGGNYTVTFDFGASGCSPWACGQSITAAAFGNDGAVNLASLIANGTSGGALGSFTFGFVAIGNETMLRFSDIASNNTQWLDGVLDNVTVQAVPEPASLTLLGLGLAGIAAGRRRRK
jgi:hypothetical protein